MPEHDARAVFITWLEGRTAALDAAAVTWALQRCVWSLLHCYPSATHEDNAAMILSHVQTILGRREG